MKFVVLPVKEFSKSKVRLSRLLTVSERAQLALAMFEDVLDVVTSTPNVDKVFVISKDVNALRLAKQKGAIVFEESEQKGQSPSVDVAGKLCMELGASTTLSLPIDVPLVTQMDIDAVLEKANKAPLVVLVPSRDRKGTNAVLRIPPDIIGSHFGCDSLNLHQKEATQKGIPCEIYTNANLALDIDDPEDLFLFISKRTETRTYSRAMEMKIHQRIDAYQKL